MKNTVNKVSVILTLFVLYLLGASASAEQFACRWDDVPPRTWAGQWFWANRLQDWRVDSGRLECIETRPDKPLRTLHVLPVELKGAPGSLELSVKTGMMTIDQEPSAKALAGFLIGAGADMDYRAAAIIHHSPGNKGGLIACVTSEGLLQFRDMASKGFPVLAVSEAPVKFNKQGLQLQVEIDGDYLELTASHVTLGKKLSGIRMKFDHEVLKGNIALLSHPGTGKSTCGFWFNDLSLSGDKIAIHSDRTCGPILATQHTLSNNVMKLSAQMMPLGDNDPRTVILEEKRHDAWERIAVGKWQAPSYTTLFRVENWDSTKDHTCRVTYVESESSEPHHYDVKVARDPVDKDVSTIAAFTGNHNNRRGLERGFYDWSASMWFPHNDIVRHVTKHQPDVMYFSGDQVYEGASPTKPDKKFLKLDYLYKWYLWCWAFRDLTNQIVSISVPDDHDVFQGNIWGQGGRKSKSWETGGYVHPADFVKMVERTQTCHLPDPYDPTPVKQGIGVYYTSLDFGGISYAILEDRKFKTGYKSKEALSNDPAEIHLLGRRQLEFLSHWTADWAPGIEMKCVLSQTIFGCLHTGWAKNAYKAGPPSDDHDTNGWPVHGRNKALREIRKGFAFMIGGDQHLATIVHHGIEDFDDAGWSFCVPSVANFYPRSWIPNVAPVKPIPGLPKYTGSYYDGFGNKVTVWGAANPTGSTGIEPAALHDRMPGYGIVHFNKKDRTIHMECWPRHAVPIQDQLQYKGWPKTIHMLDNYGKEPVAWLPTIKVSGFDKPVLQVIDQQYGDIVYTLRLSGNTFQPWTFREGRYTLRIGQPGSDNLKVIPDLEANKEKTDAVISVKFISATPVGELLKGRSSVQFIIPENFDKWEISPRGENGIRVAGPENTTAGTLHLVPADGNSWDFSAFSYFRLEIHNTSESLLWFEGRLDNEGAKDWVNSSASQLFLPAGQTGTLAIAYPRKAELNDSPEIFHDMFSSLNGWRFHWKPFDPTNVLKLQLKVHGTDSNIQFDVLGMNLGFPYGLHANASLLGLPYLDRFGQVDKLSWPGKVQNTSQLKKRHQLEVKSLKKSAHRPALNQYGGWAEGPKLKATGFFRVEKYEDKWWFVDPQGNLFWSYGVNSVGFSASTPLTENRIGLFDWLPKEDTLLFNAAIIGKKRKQRVNFLAANLFRKHGPNWEDTALDLIHQRYRLWGLNTIGAWSYKGLWDAKRTPYTAIFTTGWTNLVGKTPNPYGSLLTDNLTKTLQAYVDEYGQDPWCVGAFIDNEVHWPEDLVSEVFDQKETHPAKQAFVALLTDKYQNIEKLNAVWAAEFSDWKALSNAKDILRDETNADDFDMLYRDYARTYYKACRDALHQVMPNHLYLGSRIHACLSVAAHAAAEFVDVYSNNHYENRAGVGRLPSDVDKPVLITEFHFGALDRGVPGASLRPVHDQVQRTCAYANYIVSGLMHPKIIGAHWFAWSDQSAAGRPGENYQIGFIDTTDTPYPEFTQGCRKLGESIYSIRFGNETKVLTILEELFKEKYKLVWSF